MGKKDPRPRGVKNQACQSLTHCARGRFHAPDNVGQGQRWMDRPLGRSESEPASPPPPPPFPAESVVLNPSSTSLSHTLPTRCDGSRRKKQYHRLLTAVVFFYASLQIQLAMEQLDGKETAQGLLTRFPFLIITPNGGGDGTAARRILECFPSPRGHERQSIGVGVLRPYDGQPVDDPLPAIKLPVTYHTVRIPATRLSTFSSSAGKQRRMIIGFT